MCSGVVASASFAATCTAHALAKWRDIKVARQIVMTMLALGLVLLKLSRAATSYILQNGNRLHVPRVYAGAYATYVVNYQPVRYRSD